MDRISINRLYLISLPEKQPFAFDGHTDLLWWLRVAHNASIYLRLLHLWALKKIRKTHGLLNFRNSESTRNGDGDEKTLKIIQFYSFFHSGGSIRTY
jgi:hypothetical protein